MEKENLFENLSKIGVVVILVFAAVLKYVDERPVIYRPQGKLRMETVAPHHYVFGDEISRGQIMMQGQGMFQPFYQLDATPAENEFLPKVIFNEKANVKKVNDEIFLWPFLVF